MVYPDILAQETNKLVDYTLFQETSPDEPYILDNLKSGKQIYFRNPEIIAQLDNYDYLLMEVNSESDRSMIIRIEFSAREDAQTQGGIRATIGMLPGMKGRLVFPLEYLSAQDISMPRYPGQLKGVVTGRRLETEDIGKITIYSIEGKNSSGSAPVEVSGIYLTNDPESYIENRNIKIVDRWGQWIQKDWRGKIEDSLDFNSHAEDLRELSDVSLQFGEVYSDYGGWKELRFDSTGYFHIHNDGRRWWLVDPEGYAFLSHGMDVVSTYAPGTYSGNESIFSAIPEERKARSQVFLDVSGERMIDFFRWNMLRIFGSDWIDEWETLTRNKLIHAGFNTIGNWSDKDFISSANLPYVLPMSDFPRTRKTVFRDFPDVFSPEYRQKAAEFARQLRPYRNDPLLIGYFLRNEPHWAMGDNNPAFEMFRVRESSFTKNKFVRWIMDRYPHIDSLNNAWNTSFSFFTDLFDLRLKTYPSKIARRDFRDFSALMVREYLEVVSSETRKQAPNHLNLGMRYAYISSDLLYEASDLFDVFSVNGYHFPGPPDTEEIYERTGKPVLIGEFHFGALDRGLPSTGLIGVKNQRHRGKAYRYYAEQGFSRPEIIGIHYFQWMDQPVFGRFDGENYNIGFNDILYQSYERLYDASQKVSERMYEVAEGERKAFRRKAKKIPAVSF